MQLEMLKDAIVVTRDLYELIQTTINQRDAEQKAIENEMEGEGHDEEAWEDVCGVVNDLIAAYIATAKYIRHLAEGMIEDTE